MRPLNVVEKLEFVELNKWERHIDTIHWSVTSIYITINIILIGTFIEHWTIIQGIDILGAAISLGFIIIWDFILWITYMLIRKSIHLRYRILKLGRKWRGFLGSFDIPLIEEWRANTNLLFNIFHSLWGVLTFSFAFVFITVWWIFFVLFIDVLPSTYIPTSAGDLINIFKFFLDNIG